MDTKPNQSTSDQGSAVAVSSGSLFGIWQPIETAPRDETEILIKTDIGVVSAWFHSEPGECYHWVCYDDVFSIDGDNGRVTHWMPLPPSPNVADEGRR